MFTVGQRLWLVPNKYVGYMGEPREVEIEKVGRVWLTTKNGQYRISAETLTVDGGQYSSPGQCYLSKEAWEAEVQLRRAWEAFRGEISSEGSPPNKLTVERIKEARELLFGGCGACGDACKSRGSCRLGDESPPPPNWERAWRN